MALKDMPAKLDDLIVGDGNSKAFAAIKEIVAHYPAPKGLLLYGPSGSGKTALLRAAIGEITLQHPGLTVLWQSSEDYMRKLVSSIKADATAEFQKGYMHLNLAVVENLEDLVGKDSTQMTLARTIADAYNSGAQVFLSANHYCQPLTVEVLLRELIPGFTVVNLTLPDQISLECAWISYGQSLGLPCSTDYMDFFHGSKVKNFWALNGLLQSYFTHINCSFNEAHRSWNASF